MGQPQEQPPAAPSSPTVARSREFDLVVSILASRAVTGGAAQNVRRMSGGGQSPAGIRFEVAAHSMACYGGAMCPARA